MRDRRFRQVKIRAAEQRVNDLSANRLPLRMLQFIFQIHAHARAQLFQIFRAELFRQFVVNRRRNLFLHLDDFDFKNTLLAGQFLRHEIGGKIHVHGFLVARLRAGKLLGESGDERVRRDVHPEIFLLRQTLRRRRGFGDRLSVAGAGVIHHGHVAHFQFARDRFKFDVLLREQVQRALNILVRDGFDLRA